MPRSKPQSAARVRIETGGRLAIIFKIPKDYPGPAWLDGLKNWFINGWPTGFNGSVPFVTHSIMTATEPAFLVRSFRASHGELRDARQSSVGPKGPGGVLVFDPASESPENLEVGVDVRDPLHMHGRWKGTKYLRLDETTNTIVKAPAHPISR